jgi:hypothetical protein
MNGVTKKFFDFLGALACRPSIKNNTLWAVLSRMIRKRIIQAGSLGGRVDFSD